MLRGTGWRIVYGILVLFFLLCSSVAENKPNIVLITLDSTRAEHMDFLGGHGNLTPQLDAIARQSVVFAQAFAQAPLTVASDATVFTGTYPQTHRASELGVPLAAAVPYLPEALHSHGYRAAAFVGSLSLDPKNGPFQGYDRGFDVFDRLSPASARQRTPCGRASGD